MTAPRYQCHMCGATVPTRDGVLLDHPRRSLTTTCPASWTAPHGAPVDAECPFCKKRPMLTAASELRFHKRPGSPSGDSCDGAGLTPERAREVAAELAAKLGSPDPAQALGVKS